MRFLLDENVEHRLVGLLRLRQHDVTSIAQDYARALPDREVLAIARRERRVLITNDRDFGELVIHAGQRHFGVVYFRLPPGEVEAKLRALESLIEVHPDWLHEFVVISAAGARRRRTS